MSEERLSAESKRDRPATRGQQKRRQRSVFQYIAILFAAAFLLLLYTFAMERRQNDLLQQQNQEQQQDLQKSVSAVQTLEGLLEENKLLKQRIQALEDSIKQLEDSTKEQEQLLTQKQIDMGRTADAMDWFWQIDEAFVRNQYSKCRELIASLEEGGLENYLSAQSITGNGRFSPYDRYLEIREKVF